MPRKKNEHGMKILAVETATDACSAALNIDGEIIERYTVSPRKQAQLILPMLESLLTEADLKLPQLDALAFGRGPGSFTGVRIATGVIQGAALGADLPVVPVSTLAAMAHNVFSEYNEQTAFVALDARMGEVYWGVYQKTDAGYAKLWGEESVIHSSEVAFPQDTIGIGVGSGWSIYPKELKNRLGARITRIDPERLPRASAIVQLAVKGYSENEAVPAEKALPVYLRDQVTRKKQ